MGRAGTTFACDAEDVVPDVYVLGKALGGGIVPVSAVVADADVLGVLRPGEHGSTFGGNPLACAVGTEVVACCVPGNRRLARVSWASCCTPGCGRCSVAGWRRCAAAGCGPASTSTRRRMTGREACERLAERGVLAKDTHGSTLRLAPPLVVTAQEVEWAVEQLSAVLAVA